jgi:putative transposase
MYRLLAAQAELRERRNQLRHPRYAAPELLARRPNELWSWDITKLLGPAKWTYFYLHVMLDVFSRYVVGWMVAQRESATLAERFIRETCARQGIGRDRLTIHADRGPAMTSKSVAFLLADLGITKTHSRPHVSNDNPFSEAQFKTLKYRPVFPARFGSIQDARAHCHGFSPGTTSNIITAASACSRLMTCTPAWPSIEWRPGPPCWPPPTRRTRSASRVGSPSRRRVPWRCGSIPQRRGHRTSRLIEEGITNCARVSWFRPWASR